MMRQFVYILTFAMTFFALQGFAQASDCQLPTDSTTSFQKLEQIIRNKKCNIKSIDDLLQLMPEEMRSHYSLVYRSQSLQGPHNVDYQNPRAILFTSRLVERQKRLYISFNGKATQANFKNLEVLEVDTTVPAPSTDIFRYFDIQFPDDKKAVALSWEDAQKAIQVSDANPKKCQSCHGLPAKPIFQSYPIWNGVYGSLHLINSDQKEKQELEKFINNKVKTGDSRYRHLIATPNDYNHIGSDGVPFVQRLFEGFFNVAINVTLTTANDLRNARLARATSDYDKYSAALVGGALDCQDFKGFIPEKVRATIDQNILVSMALENRYPEAKVDKILKKFFDLGPMQFGYAMGMAQEKYGYGYGKEVTWDEFKNAHKNFWDGWGAMNLLWIDTMERQGPHRSDSDVAKIRYVMEGRGQDISTWFLDIKQPTYRMSDGVEWANSLGFRVLYDDPGLSQFVDLAQKADRTSDYYKTNPINDPSQLEGPKKDLCDALRKESFSRLSTINKVEKLKAKSFDNVIHKGQYPKTFINTCSTCHTTNSSAPRIPFLDVDEFKSWYGKSTNSKKLHHRLTTDNDLDRMPLNRDLDKTELDGILEYLKLLDEQ